MRIVLLVYALLAILVSGGLLFKKSGKPSILLGVFVLIFGLEIVDFLYGTSHLIFIYPQYSLYFYFQSGFLYGPLLLWHFRYYIEKDFRFSAVQMVHLIPFFIVLFYLLEILALPGLERLAYVNNNFKEVIMPINYIRAFHLLSYGLVLISYLYKSRYSLKEKDKIYTVSITVLYFISCIVISWFTAFANTWRDFDLYYLIACTIILVIGFLLYTDPDFLREVAQKYLKSTISKQEKKRINAKIEWAFIEEEIFKRKDVSLNMLSELIDEKNHYISQTFSEENKGSFQTYVNKHRISYAKKLLADPENHKFTIEAIGEEAGFNNRVSFYKAFRQFTSTTPSEFRKKHRI